MTKCICLFLLDELKEKLQDFVSETNKQRPGFIKVVRHDKQEGLIRSRVSGWRAATAPVVALFDAHVEFNVGWWVTAAVYHLLQVYCYIFCFTEQTQNLRCYVKKVTHCQQFLNIYTTYNFITIKQLWYPIKSNKGCLDIFWSQKEYVAIA